MANLKTLSGFPIQNLTSDPVPYAQALADNPYAGVWSSGGALNTARLENFGNGVGTQTAAGVSGGYTTADVALHEQYNGTSWTEAADLNTARSGTWADGTQSASWVAGGATPSYVTNTETWNGSSWTEVNEINTARAYGGGTCGRSSTAGLVVAGYTGTANSNAVESWDGTNWTEVSEVNTARRKAGGFGTSTAAFAVGAAPSPGNPGATALVESWNGSAWTETTDINTGRGAVGGAGTTTDGLIFGSEQTPRQITEAWNGTAWSEVNDMGVNQGNSAGAGGTGTSAFIAGGTNGSTAVANTEEWTFSGLPPSTPAADYSDAIVGQMYYNSTSGQFKAIKNGGPPIGSWSSGGNLPQNMILQGAFGGRDSVTTGGGSISTGIVGDSFQYNGVAWSEITELSTVRNQSAGLGTQNAGLVAGGYRLSPGAVVGVVENWNGSSWTEVADVSPVRQGAGSAGVYTAGLVFGGAQPPNTASTMTWNGSAWTEVNDLNAARNRFMGQAIGTQTAALAVEGEGVAGTESWNGTSWTEVNDLNTPRHLGGGSGIQTSAIVSSGRTGAPGYNPSVLCESWDGSSWTEVADVSSARAYLSSAGTAAGNPNATSIIFGGATTSSTANTAATEEWNAADFTINPVTTS